MNQECNHNFDGGGNYQCIKCGIGLVEFCNQENNQPKCGWYKSKSGGWDFYWEDFMLFFQWSWSDKINTLRKPTYMP